MFCALISKLPVSFWKIIYASYSKLSKELKNSNEIFVDQGVLELLIFSTALTYCHKINGWADPTDNFIVHKLKDGCCRQHYCTNVRWPITVPLLGCMVHALHSVCSSSFEVPLSKAAFVTAFFFCFLQVGEFTAASKAADPAHIFASGLRVKIYQEWWLGLAFQTLTNRVHQYLSASAQGMIHFYVESLPHWTMFVNERLVTVPFLFTLIKHC